MRYAAVANINLLFSEFNMFYYLKGELTHVAESTAVIECGGVGYKLTVSATTLGSLPSIVSDCPDVKLFTYMAVREDSVELYGFYTTEELDLFKMLISISGVGPKAAMSILSLMSPSALADAITSQNVKMISRAPGVGVKTAQRIVLELSGKLVTSEASQSTGTGASSATKRMPSFTEAQDALIVLGYSRAEAQTALKNVPDADKKSTEELIKAALVRLM